MKILKRFADEEVWNETTQEECLDRTEGSGYWKPGSVLSMLAEGHVIHTPFARYKAAEQSAHPTLSKRRAQRRLRLKADVKVGAT